MTTSKSSRRGRRAHPAAVEYLARVITRGIARLERAIVVSGNADAAGLASLSIVLPDGKAVTDAVTVAMKGDAK